MKNPKKQEKLFRNSIPGIIFLGIIGTALWEWVISPLSAFLFIYLSNKIESFKIGFTDSIYKKIAIGPDNIFSYASYMAIMWAAFLFIFLIIRKSSQIKTAIEQAQNENIVLDDDEPINSKAFFALLVGMVIVFALEMSVIFYAIGRFKFIDETRYRTLANIEIVAPYIDEQDYKMLKSNFYTMQNKNDFDTLSQSLEDIASENGLQLQQIGD